MNESQVSDEPLCGKSLRVLTGSRLHFGLLDTNEPFGGVGVMLEEPATEITLTPSDRFCCQGDESVRVHQIAERLSQLAGMAELPACRIDVERRPHSHTGMGSGTQLAMSVAEAVCRFSGVKVSPTDLARNVAGRGQRSAVGVHGYFHGGLILETTDEPCDINPVRCRVEPPVTWCVALFQPKAACHSVSGSHERDHFSRLTSAAAEIRAGLTRLVTQRMLPAAASGDFEMFADAVGQYNYQSGMLFDSVQRGAYNGRAVAELIETLQHRGARGVGQSSWGPSVFAWFESQDEATEFARAFTSDLADHRLTAVRNRPRKIEEID